MEHTLLMIGMLQQSSECRPCNIQHKVGIFYGGHHTFGGTSTSRSVDDGHIAVLSAWDGPCSGLLYPTK